MRESKQERFRSVASQLFDIVLIIDPQGIVHYTNDSLTRVLGTRPEEYIGTSAFANVQADDVSLLMESLASGMKQPGEPLTVEFRARHTTARGASEATSQTSSTTRRSAAC